MKIQKEPERIHTVVIGGGQAGLSVGYHLARRHLPFVILDAHERIGDSWRKRWDSLRLFTPARFDGLDGMPFPAAADAFPTKDEMADYLEAYAARFELPVRNGVTVNRLSRQGDRYLVTAGDRQFEAEHVVIAMANYQQPRVPAFARDLDPSHRPTSFGRLPPSFATARWRRPARRGRQLRSGNRARSWRVPATARGCRDETPDTSRFASAASSAGFF